VPVNKEADRTQLHSTPLVCLMKCPLKINRKTTTQYILLFSLNPQNNDGMTKYETHTLWFGMSNR